MSDRSPTTDPQDGMLSVDELRKRIVEILGLEFSPDGLPDWLLTRDEGGVVIEGIDYHDEVNELLALFTAATSEKLPASGDSLKPSNSGELDYLSTPSKNTDFASGDEALRDLTMGLMTKHFAEQVKSLTIVDYNGKTVPLLDYLLPYINTAKQTAVAEAEMKAEHYWIKYYGDQRKFLDGSDGDMAQINELKRHQQLHKDRLAEMRNVLEGKS
jgi:hypothetical protein